MRNISILVLMVAVFGCANYKENGDVSGVSAATVAEGIDYLVDNYKTSRIVVGETAPAEHAIGAIDIATALQAEISDGSMPNAVLDSEIMANPFMYNLISVGASLDNQVTNLLMGDAILPDDKGVIQFYKTNPTHIAIVAAGKTPLDVRKACTVLANFKDYDLNGSTIYVSGATLADLTTEIIAP